MAYTKRGTIRVATDVSMTVVLNNPSSQFRPALIALLESVAVGVIANNPTIIQAAEAAAEAAVAAELASANILRAYPEGPVARTSLSAVPMQWVYKTMSDPYPTSYPTVYPGTWSGSLQRRGEVPVLSSSGKLDAAQIPDSYPTNAVVDQRIAAAIESIEPGPGPGPAGAVPDRPSSFWAMVAKARRSQAPVGLVWAGSSTPFNNPGFVLGLSARMQAAMYPDGVASPVQWSTSADFTPVTSAGLHVYNAAEGGTRSVNYLTEAEMDKIAALGPACIVHMPVANDYTNQIAPAVVRDALQQKLDYLDSKLPGPCQHVYVQSYARLNFTPSNYQHAAYGDLMREIAHSHPTGVYLDLSIDYRPVGVPGADPLGLISADDVHQTPDGYSFMEELVFKFFTS